MPHAAMVRIRLLSLACGLLLVLGVAPRAAAQQPTPERPTDVSRAELDFRLGHLWPLEDPLSRPTVGGRLILYLWPEQADGRLSLHVTGDFRRIGRREAFDEEFSTRSVTERSFAAIGPSLAWDVVRRPWFVVDARAGGLVAREWTSFLINSADGFVNDNDEFENVCPFQGFSHRCPSDFSVLGAFSGGIRAYLGAYSSVFVGLDYTFLTSRKHLVAGSIGVRLE